MNGGDLALLAFSVHTFRAPWPRARRFGKRRLSDRAWERNTAPSPRILSLRPRQRYEHVFQRRFRLQPRDVGPEIVEAAVLLDQRVDRLAENGGLQHARIVVELGEQAGAVLALDFQPVRSGRRELV